MSICEYMSVCDYMYMYEYMYEYPTTCSGKIIAICIYVPQGHLSGSLEKSL